MIIHEASSQAGGRCRSLFDKTLQTTIDNGSHLLLSANHHALSYVRDIGSLHLLERLPAAFPFLNVTDGRKWLLRMNSGPIPWWIGSRARRVPSTTLGDYCRSAYQILRARPEITVAKCLGFGSLEKYFWYPFTLAVLNACPDQACVSLLRPVLREILLRGSCPIRPWNNLSAVMIEPALTRLRTHGASIHFGHRLQSLDHLSGSTITRLNFGIDHIDLIPGDTVVMAVPPIAASRLLPSLAVPLGSQAIINGHFRVPTGISMPFGLPFLGLCGGQAQWLFYRENTVSATISGVSAELLEKPKHSLARMLWDEIAPVIGLGGHAIPPARIIKERHATFTPSYDNVKRRPATVSRWDNLLLAGDWIDTGLPATIEGAIYSGHRAAAALERLARRNWKL